jgi:hypothetical protein
VLAVRVRPQNVGIAQNPCSTHSVVPSANLLEGLLRDMIGGCPVSFGSPKPSAVDANRAWLIHVLKAACSVLLYEEFHLPHNGSVFSDPHATTAHNPGVKACLDGSQCLPLLPGKQAPLGGHLSRQSAKQKTLGYSLHLPVNVRKAEMLKPNSKPLV